MELDAVAFSRSQRRPSSSSLWQGALYTALPRRHVRKSPCFFAFTINARSFAGSCRVVHFAWIASPGWAGASLIRASRTIASLRQIGAS
jgi:hypothetical protein